MNTQKKKAIELLLFDGSMDGIVVATQKGSNTKALKIPRSKLSEAAAEIKKCNIGVYFLFSEKTVIGIEKVYIGESEKLYTRLLKHANNKVDWITAVAFCGADLNKAIIRYIEKELFAAVKANGHNATIKQAATSVAISESDILFAENFIEEIRMFLGVFGYVALRTAEKESEVYFCKAKDADSTGFLSTNGFTVQKGSRVATKTTETFKRCNYRILRDALEQDAIIKDFVFQQDYAFNSPSAAASVIIGHNCNGMHEWRTADNVKLGDV